eukprot:TRINITY_DN34192_c0_g1_i1.p1 TRINITY_DN34192_c0_g1~~TRINITY_DN34192_c0_g1_i1.p1  ORF type:complete len:136 (+),score=49.35 TRINITY_DN34192_c0_g1_i1:56-409(+)
MLGGLRHSASAAEASVRRTLVTLSGGTPKEPNEYDGMSSAQMVAEAKKLAVPGKTPKIFSNRLDSGFATDHIGRVFRHSGQRSHRSRGGHEHLGSGLGGKVHSSMHSMNSHMAYGDI